MIYPIKNWKAWKRGYIFGQPTSYSPHHLGLDVIVPVGTPIFAPTDGRVINHLVGAEGGLTIWFQMSNGKVVRFMHLSHLALLAGPCKEGALLCWSGNSGSITSGAHCHIDVTLHTPVDPNNFSKFEDPDKTFADADYYPVDGRYGQNKNAAKEVAMGINPWLIAKLGRRPTYREIKGLLYGHWDFEAVYKNRVGLTWLKQIKP